MEIIEFLKPYLELSALLLGLINGLILLQRYLRDKPHLVAKTRDDSYFQCFCRLPDGEYLGNETRKWGFFLYINIINKGLRNVEVSSWYLQIKLRNGKMTEMKHMSITNPVIDLGIGDKYLPILGIKSLEFSGETLVRSGQSIAGIAFYSYECYGDESFDPFIDSGIINGKLIVRDVFDKKVSCSCIIPRKDLDHVKTYIPNIEEFNGI